MNAYYKYENDVGDNDDYFVEYWSVYINDEKICDASTESNAILICGLLNANKGCIGNTVSCDVCGHEWKAMYFKTSDKLECPNCHNMSSFEII